MLEEQSIDSMIKYLKTNFFKEIHAATSANQQQLQASSLLQQQQQQQHRNNNLNAPMGEYTQNVFKYNFFFVFYCPFFTE